MDKYINILADTADSTLKFCDSYNVLVVFYFIKQMLTLLCIIVPIVLIVMLTIDVVKTVISGNIDEDIKKMGKKFAIRLLVCFAFFFLPTIVNLIAKTIQFVSYDASKCWINAEKSYITTLKTQKGNNIKNSDVNAKNKQNEEEEKKTQKSNEAKESLNNMQQNTQNNNTNNSSIQTNGKLIFLGDSRTVGLKEIGKNDANTYFVCQSGMGYNWFLETAISEVDQLATTDGFTILFNLGVNDGVMKNVINESRANEYVSKIKELANGSWSKHKIVIVSVFPINNVTNKYFTVNDNGVVLFNDYMKNNLQGISNVSYCDVYNGLSRDKFIDSGDGLHYTTEGYRNIYNYMKQNCV